MKTPPVALLDLDSLGTIRGIHVESCQTGVDTTDTYCELIGTRKTLTGSWGIFKRYLDVHVSHDSVASIAHSYQADIDAWHKYRKENQQDYETYKKLKAKFE